MANKIRSLMQSDINVISGIVEMDETYIGGKETNKHKNKKSLTGFIDKDIVVGIKARDGKLVANVEKNSKKATLRRNIYDHIGMNSLIITDELPAYKDIQGEGYWTHKKINHSKKQYAKYESLNNSKIVISINSIESFWSLFKRSLRGTYMKWSKKWLQSYVNEFVFRYNYRNKNLFNEILKRA